MVISQHNKEFNLICYVEYSLSRATMLLSTTRSHDATFWSQHENDKVASVTSRLVTKVIGRRHIRAAQAATFVAVEAPLIPSHDGQFPQVTG